MRLLNEGLRPNDLEGLMSNVLSVDEYESKIDDSALVIAFSIADRHAAVDANRFIQKSYVELLDSEVSAAPDQNGNYLLFIEIPMNDKAAKATAQLCSDMSSLGGFDEWRVRVRGFDTTQALPADKIEQVVRVKMEANLKEFFEGSKVNKVLAESQVLVASNEYEMNVNIVDFGAYEHVFKRNNLDEAAIDMSIEAQRSCRLIKNVLGNRFTVEKIDEAFVVFDSEAKHLLLLSN